MKVRVQDMETRNQQIQNFKLTISARNKEPGNYCVKEKVGNRKWELRFP